MGNNPSDCVVETIAGWALAYASAFPQTSGIITSVPKTKEQWNCVYNGARNILVRGPLREIVGASYSGAYIDEYQDCTVQQHRLVLAIADIIPTRILGDALQGIFDFGDNEPVDWDRDIRPNFEELPPLTGMWRWENRNQALGRWLVTARNQLLQHQPIELRNAPVNWEKLPTTNAIVRQLSVCLRIARQDSGSVVAIHRMPQQCHFIGSRLRGLYQCVEPIDSQDLFESAQRIQTSDGPAKAAEVIEFAGKCMTQVRSILSRVRTVYRSGSVPSTRQGPHSSVFDALRRVAEEGSYAAVIAALEQIRSIPGVIVFRRELFDEMLRGVRAAIINGNGALDEALWRVRNRTRFSGRRLGRCVVGRTVLVKGLEFDHAIVLDADGMNAKDLYVALTRGAQSLTIFSQSQTITPR
jgi:DNA helicase-2/ATP-dependent DNA helicase PcrA